MRLVMIDSDGCYLERLQSVVSMTKQIPAHSDLELHTGQTIEDIHNMKQLDFGSSVLCVHENELSRTMEFLTSSYEGSKPDILVMVEGYVSPSLNNYVTSCPELCSCYEDIFIQKYQRTDRLINDIKASWLSLTQLEQPFKGGESKLIAVFSPMTAIDQSKKLSKVICGMKRKRRQLIVHFDPYYCEISDEKGQDYRQSISYFMSLITRKENISFLLKQMVVALDEERDQLMGPMNMLDLECLSQERMRIFIDVLKKQSGYDDVILQFCGVHINGFIRFLLENSDERVMVTDCEDVQMILMRQLPLSWTPCNGRGYEILKEVLK